MVYIFGPTDYKALMEINWNEADYNTAIGTKHGKAFKPIGTAPALAKDFNELNNNFLRIDSERKVYNKKFIETTTDGKLALNFQNESIPSTIR